MDQRKEIKSRRPSKFTRHEAGSKPRIKSNWRKPNGHQNKLRLNRKGHASPIAQGYRMPKGLRNVHTQTGKEIVHVQNVADLQAVDAKKNIVIFAASIGVKKKITLLEQAEKLGVEVLLKSDSKSLKEDITTLQKGNKDVKAQKAKALAEAEEKKSAKKKSTKKEEKPSVDDKVDAEEQKQKEKKEQEKVLHHKE